MQSDVAASCRSDKADPPGSAFCFSPDVVLRAGYCAEYASGEVCIVAGILLGRGFPSIFQTIARLEVAQVNIPVGVLIWVMIIPMLIKIDFGALAQVKGQWRGIGVTLFVNWLVKPFSMAFLGWLFIRHLFAGWLPADQLDSYIAGLVLLAAAPCTAMVFVWSQLCKGAPYFTLSQVALNDSIMIVAFAPLVAQFRSLSAWRVDTIRER